MTLASHLGMTLNECLTKVSHREYLVWLAWLNDQWNRPSRSDHYAMQVAQEVRMLRRPDKSVPLDDLKITFKPKPKASDPAAKKQLAEWWKSIWIGFVKSCKGNRPK